MTPMRMNIIETAPKALAHRIRTHLQGIAALATPITYLALAEELDLTPPNTIHQITDALEHLMREDTANGQPFIAALVISKTWAKLPAPGFFDCAWRLGRYDGELSGTEAWTFHEAEFDAAVAFWSPAEATKTNNG